MVHFWKQLKRSILQTQKFREQKNDYIEHKAKELNDKTEEMERLQIERNDAIAEEHVQQQEAWKWRDAYDTLVTALKEHKYDGCYCALKTIGAM